MAPQGPVPLERVRNIWIFAHIDAWKTTTSERILFYTWRIHKIWETHNWEWTMDWMAQEKERWITITSAATTAFWKDKQINLIDTPWHVDFTIEVERSLRVLDGWIAVFDASQWVEPQSETVWKQADKYWVSRIGFVNKMDKTGWDYFMTIESIKKKLAWNKVIAAQLPIWSEWDFMWIIDLVQLKAFTFEWEHGEKIVEIEIPADLKDKAESMRAELIEKAAEQDEKLMEKFFEKGELTIDEIKSWIRAWVVANNLYPIYCGTALQNKWVQLVIDAACDFLPSPVDVNGWMVDAMNPDNKEEVRKIPMGDNSSLWALAFKIATDPFVWRITYVRVYSWVLRAWTYVYNPVSWEKERIWRLLQMHANERIEIEEIRSGHIWAVIWLKDTRTWDTLCDLNDKFLVESMEFPEPVIHISVEPKTKADQEKMWIALGKLAEEDPSFRVSSNPETNQTIISWMWELHLDIIVDRMKREFKVECNVWAPQVAYRETIKSIAKDSEVKYAKQSWGRGQFGHVVITFEPYTQADSDDKDGIKLTNKFVNKIVGWVIPKEYIPWVEKWLNEAYARWFLAWYPMVDIKATLTFGSYHDVDSSELAFKIAASKAFKQACKKASATLLEPIMKVEINTPEEYMWDVLWQVNSKRWRIEEMGQRGQAKIITAYIPLAEMFGYTTELRSASQWRATYAMEFHHYDDVPANLATKIREERWFKLEDDED